MLKFASFVALLVLTALPALAGVETYKNVSVVDVACSAKVAADADSHTRACALKCEKSGFAIVISDKKVVKLDADGNAKVVEALKASDKKDHLRVDVTGDLQGDTLKVTSIKLL
jgi:hypothetical protein